MEGNRDIVRPRYTPSQLRRNRFFVFIVLCCFAFMMIRIPIEDHLSITQSMGFYGIFLFAVLVALVPIMLALSARKGRVVERADWAASQGIHYVDVPDKALGSDITIGSVIASGGDIDWPYDSFLSGTRNNYSYRAVDYGYWVSGPRGGGAMIQTVVCIDLKANSNTVPFSLIAPDLMEHCLKAKKIRFDLHLVSALIKNRSLVVDRERSGDPNVSYEFLRVFRHMPDANVEYLGDRLLVYRIYQKLTGNDYLEWIDYAIELAKLA